MCYNKYIKGKEVIIMTNVDRIQILKSAVEDMAQFIRDNPPTSLPEEKSMSIKDSCRCFVDAESDPTGQKILEYFITKSYNKYMKKGEIKND
jgi:hypothetical protein